MASKYVSALTAGLTLPCPPRYPCRSERKRLAGRCDVLVATPGRLIDHLENGGLAAKLQGIRTLVSLLPGCCLPAANTATNTVLLLSAAGERERCSGCGCCYQYSTVCSALPACLAAVQVLDEADQLLEMGFRPAIEKILGEWVDGWVLGGAGRVSGKTLGAPLHAHAS